MSSIVVLLCVMFHVLLTSATSLNKVNPVTVEVSSEI